MSLLGLCHLAKRFGPNVVIDDINFSADAGEFFALVGPSECGRSTLLRQIGGLLEPGLGEILFEGRSLTGIPPGARPIHTVFQSCALFPHMTVADSTSFTLRMRGLSRRGITQRVEALIEDVRLQGHENHFPHELPDGQRQHVAIARALAAGPRLLLLDELLSASDAALQAQIQHELIALQQQVKVAFVCVTHDQVYALTLSQRIAVMRAGRIVQIDKPEIIYRQPMTRFVAGFIGTCNLLDKTIERTADGCLRARIDGLDTLRVNSAEPLVLGSRGTVATHPEQIRLQREQVKAADDQSSSWPGVIRDRLYQGDVTLYTVEPASGPHLQAMMANAATTETGQFQQGGPTGLTWPETAGVLLCH